MAHFGAGHLPSTSPQRTRGESAPSHMDLRDNLSLRVGYGGNSVGVVTAQVSAGRDDGGQSVLHCAITGPSLGDSAQIHLDAR